MKRLFGLYICPFIALLFVLIFLLPTLVEADATTFDSDDFNSFNLNTVWTFIDPVGNATLMMTGTNTSNAWLSISVPGGTAHDVWTENQAPRIMQPADDTDFELEVKFESGLSQRYQMQGVLVEQDNDDFLRFDFHSDGSSTRIFATSFSGGTPTEPPLINSAIAGTNVFPLYMRVKREGDLWTQFYSYDGLIWTPSISFTHALAVNWVGPFVGNTGARSDGLDSPAHTGDIDYFFNTASPMVPEDVPGVVDETPPLIYNVQDIAGQTRLRVTWSTDEPATGTVQYGQTTAYELGSVSHADFTLHHTLLITDLLPDTIYYYEVVSEDSSGYSNSKENFVVTTDPLGTSPNPVIDIWYGPHQVFGDIGIPQQWINVLGDVSDPEEVASLTYSLNGGLESPLSIGPDTRRLASEGDFNVDIDIDHHPDLISGLNQVVITATDKLDNTAVETVTVEYVSGSVWPETYSIDWSSVITIPSVAQVVDGLWTKEAGSIRPTVLGYDRLVAIGDMTWADYEVRVPITIHGIDPAGFQPPSNNPGVGILMRWTGHTDIPISGWQPQSGWNPFGAIGWLWWSNPSSAELQFFQTGVSEGFVPALEVRYIFKLRVESVPGPGGLYSLKVWEDGQDEPSAWNLIYQADSSNLANGSFMLFAHHVDASFGNVTVTPGPFDDTVPPVISNIQITPGETSATVTWTTNEPATSTVAYGLSPAYENGSVTDNTLVTEHAITLTDLFQGTLYHYKISSADEHDNVASSTDLTFTTAGVASSIVSDDFNTCELNTGLWEFTNLLGDAAQAMMGTFTQDAWLSISVPAGTDHDIWEDGNFAPRIMQPIGDTDFEIEVKFESPLTETYQMQGVLVEQDNDDFLRFEFHSKYSDTRLYAAIFEPDPDPPPTLKPIEKYNQPITVTNVAPLYMRVRRQEDQWTQSYSYDGVDWTTPVIFTHPLAVTAVGTYAGNATSGASPPAHTAYIDYFFNRASPIVPEDGTRNTLTVGVDPVGSGTVHTDPVKSTYGCDEVVTLTASSNIGWTFHSWSGPDAGELSDNGDGTWCITMDGNKSVTATFVGGSDTYIFLPIITAQYSH